MAQYCDTAAGLGNDHPITRRLWLLVMHTAPDWFVDEMSAMAKGMGLIPDPAYCDDDGTKFYRLDTLAEKLGVPAAEVEQHMAELRADAAAVGLPDSMLTADARDLHRAGVLVPGWRGGWCWYRNGEKRASITLEVGASFVRLQYDVADHQGGREGHDYHVGLSWTGCNYGGSRPWFLCPCCGRRVAILYGGAVFACRHCRGLAYEVQRETAGDRAIRRADAIRDRLGWQAGILNPDGWKPKGMHWRTFWRLKAEHDQMKGAGMQAWAQQLGIVEGRLDRIGR